MRTGFMSQAALALFVLSLLLPASVVRAQGGGGKKNIAIMTLKNASGITVEEAELITDRLGVELFNTGRVNVMERNQMKDILKEQGFQASGACTDEACMVEMGQLLGVESLVTGSVGKLGTMYLVNLRMISVRTAEITHVVSEDITGGLEEVALRMKRIAAQLVGEAVAEKPKQKPKPKAEPKPQKPQPEPEPQPAAEPEPVPQLDEKQVRNMNRSGVRLSYSLAFGESSVKLDKIEGKVDESWVDEYTVVPAMRLGLDFMIRAGKVLHVSLGPAYMFRTEEYVEKAVSGLDEVITLKYRIIGIEPGLNFVKRIYPLKINAGAMVGANLVLVKSSYSGNYSIPPVDRYVCFGMSFGGRGGLELLAGPHVGFSVDFAFRYLRFSFDESDGQHFQLVFLPPAAAVTEPEITVVLPSIGLCVGINFYF